MDASSTNRTAVSSSGGIRQFMQRHPILCYFVMAYGFSWVAWIPYVLSQDGLGLLAFRPGQTAFLPGMYLGPLLSGLLMTAVTEGKSGVGRLLRRFVQWRVAWYWYLVPLMVVPALTFLGFMTLPGAMQALHPVFPQLFWIFPAALVLEIFTSGLAEEPGWRGFALPRLQKRCGPLLGTVILGVLWQCWHLPLYLTEWGHGAGVEQISLSVASSIGISILITWVFNHTQGSLFMVILIHAALDAFGATLQTSVFTPAWLEKDSYLALLIGFGTFALLMIVFTRGRLGYKQTSIGTDVTTVLDKYR